MDSELNWAQEIIDELEANSIDSSRAMKLAAQTATGSAGRPAPATSDEQFLDDMQKAWRSPTKLSGGW